MEYKITVTVTIENENLKQAIFYLKSLLEYLKGPNNFLNIKNYEIIDSQKFIIKDNK
jgi:hypothetical protein